MPQLLDRLDRLTWHREQVRFDEIVTTIGAQGHAPLLLVAAVLMILPIGMVPGIGGALGLLVAVIGAQMLRGHRGIWLPGFIRRRSVPAERLNTGLTWLRPKMVWLCRHLRIRLEFLSGSRASLNIIALVLILAGLSLIVLGAVPVTVPLTGLPVAVFAFGILARDGAVVAVGYVMLATLGVAGVWML